MTDHKRIFDDPEALSELAQKSFAEAKRQAIAQNDRLGIPTYGSKDGKIVMRHPEPGTTSLEDGEPHPAAHAALQYINALSSQQRQDFLLTFSSLAIEGNRLAEVCYGTLRRLIDRQPVSDRYVLGLAWEIKSILERGPGREPLCMKSAAMKWTPPFSDFYRIEARSLAMHRLIAEKVLADPALLDIPRDNLRRWKKIRGNLPVYEEWETILGGSAEHVAQILCDPSERATRLRHSSPFAGVLTEEARRAIYAQFSATPGVWAYQNDPDETDL